MAGSTKIWKKGRGKLGVFAPLLGKWKAESDSPMGKVVCTREFKMMPGDQYVQLDAVWKFGQKEYVEHAVYGAKDGVVVFWSFTSDGKNSAGVISDGTDVHPEALCFEAEMPAGIARMIYWPAEDGFFWAVESKNKKGWNRFTEHHYRKTK